MKFRVARGIVKFNTVMHFRARARSTYAQRDDLAIRVTARA